MSALSTSARLSKFQAQALRTQAAGWLLGKTFARTCTLWAGDVQPGVDASGQIIGPLKPIQRKLTSFRAQCQGGLTSGRITSLREERGDWRWLDRQMGQPSVRGSGHEDATWQANPEKGQSGGDVIQPRLNHNYTPTRPQDHPDASKSSEFDIRLQDRSISNQWGIL